MSPISIISARQRMQRISAEHGAHGGDAHLESAARLQRGEGCTAHFGQQVAGQTRRRRQDLVEGQRGGEAHLREKNQSTKSLLLPLHRSSSHWKKEKVRKICSKLGCCIGKI